jgi:general secretion pathway protein G
MESRTERTHGRAGFTLLEMMAVVMIIGLLMTLIGTQVAERIDGARVTTTQAKIKQLEQALEMYKMDNARYPSTEQGLMALVEKPSGDPEPKRWQVGGYVKRDMLQDAWQEDFQYESPGTNNPRSFDLWSLGADAAPGGEGNDGDLGNWSVEASGG